MRNLSAVLIVLLVARLADAASPALTIDAPRGGEVYAIGQTQKVRMATKTKAKAVKIELSRDGGATFELLGSIDNTVRDRATRNILSFSVAGAASSNCVIRASGAIRKTEIVAISSPFSIGSAVAILEGAALADGSVTNPKLAASAVSSDKITSGPASSGFILTSDGSGGASFLTPPSASGVVTNAGNSIVSALNDLATTTTISGAKLSDGSVTSAKIADGSIEVVDLSAAVEGRYVKVAGDSMTGKLNLPSDGMTVGANQLVAAGGKIGIATATPIAPLEIVGNWTGDEGAVRITGDKPTLRFTGGAFTNNQSWMIHLGSDGPGNFQFWRRTGSATWSHVVSLTPTGRVGIGTTAPSSTLSVAGTIENTSGGIKYPDGTTQSSAAMLPIAYAYINSDGTKASGTSNVSSLWDAATSKYVITIAGENYDMMKYVTVITCGSPVSGIGTAAVPNTHQWTSTDGKLRIGLNLSNTAVQREFQFITFKP